MPSIANTRASHATTRWSKTSHFMMVLKFPKELMPLLTNISIITIEFPPTRILPPIKGGHS